MGEAHARRFIAEGAKVALTDLNEAGGSKLATELGPNALFVKHDITSMADWGRVVKVIEGEFGGPVTCLVQNAGIIGPVSPLEEISEEDYLKVIAVNQHR